MLMLFMTFFPWRLCLVCGTEDLHLCGAKPLASFWLLLFAGDICVVDQLAVSLLVGTLSCTLVSRGLSTNSFWWRAVWCCCGVFVEHSWNCRRRWSSPRTCAWTWKIRRLEKVCIFLHLVCPWITDITWLRDVTVGLLIVCTVGASVGGVDSLLRACRASCEPLSASLPCLNTVGPKLKKSPESSLAEITSSFCLGCVRSTALLSVITVGRSRQNVRNVVTIRVVMVTQW